MACAPSAVPDFEIDREQLEASAQPRFGAFDLPPGLENLVDWCIQRREVRGEHDQPADGELRA